MRQVERSGQPKLPPQALHQLVQAVAGAAYVAYALGIGAQIVHATHGERELSFLARALDDRTPLALTAAAAVLLLGAIEVAGSLARGGEWRSWPLGWWARGLSATVLLLVTLDPWEDGSTLCAIVGMGAVAGLIAERRSAGGPWERAGLLLPPVATAIAIAGPLARLVTALQADGFRGSLWPGWGDVLGPPALAIACAAALLVARAPNELARTAASVLWAMTAWSVHSAFLPWFHLCLKPGPTPIQVGASVVAAALALVVATARVRLALRSGLVRTTVSG